MQPNSNFGTNIQSVMNSTTPTQGGMYQVEKSSTPVGYEKIYYPPGKTPDPSLRYPGAPPASFSNPSWTPPTQSVTPPSSPTQTSATPKTTLRQIIDYSKANPNTDYAKRAGQLIQSGGFDAEAQKEGIDLSWAGRPPLQKQNSTTQPMQSTNPIVETAQNLGGQYNDATNKIESSVEQGAAGLQKAAQDPDPITGIGDSIKALGETGLGTAAGAVQAIFAPISAPIQTLIQHLSAASDAQKANGTPGITDNIVNSPQADAARKAISDWSSAHPELARTLGDAFTVGTAALGSGGEGDILNQSVSDVARGAVDTAKNAVSNVKDMVVKSPEAQAAKITQQAIKDTTPAYSKSLVGESDIKGVPRVQEGGILTSRTVTPTDAEVAAGKELAKIPNYPVKGTALQKFNAIEPEIAKEGKALATSLKDENILRPPKEVAKIVKTAINNASENSVLLQKTDPIVKNYMRVANKAITQSDGTLAGELKVRQALDNAYADAGGKYINNKGLDQIHRAARNALNDDLEAKAVNTEVKASLKKQSNLYKAQDVLQDKAKAEGANGLKRWIKNNPKTMTAVKIGGGTAAYETAKRLGVPLP